MSRVYKFRYVLMVILTSLLMVSAHAQQEKSETSTKETEEKTKTRTELLNELSLRTAQVDLEHANETYERYKSMYEDAQRLFKKQIISQKELDDALSAYTQAQQLLKQAEIQLEKTKLSFLAKASHITIMEAKKYYDSQGRRMLDLVLKNNSNLTLAESALGLTETGSESQLQSGWQNPEQIRALLNIENIFVSVVNDTASSIGKPYEKIIPILHYDEQEKLTFTLLTDVQEAGVKLQYLDQTVTEKIFLEKESLQEKPTAVASQFSVEGQLGSNITFDLVFEMLVTSENNFSLVITNMPPQINCYFIEGGARITSVRFSEEVSKHNLILTVSIPQKLDVNMIDKKIDFQTWIATSAQLEKINKLKRQYAPNIIPANELDTIDASRVDLILIPKGTGRLEILINNLFEEIKPQQDVRIRADLHNDGTLTLFNIIPEILPPLDWEARVEPNNIGRLLPNEKLQINILLQPGTDVGVGEYEAQIEARGQSGSEVVEALEKRLKIRISAKTNITATLILVLGLVALISGIVFMGVKLSRR
ncbi:MAG: NEW3 domain-containing protein [Sedimentisphaerales bacterium]